MKKLIGILLFFLTFTVAFGQNLISNGGFESGTTGWSGWWSRDNKGTATVVSTSAYSGTKALQVTYTGSQDWSYTINKEYSVKTGDLFELSAWVNASSAFSDAQLSVELKDSTGTVTNWVYEPARLPIPTDNTSNLQAVSVFRQK